MPPKKSKKQVLSLGEFLVDDTLGSWADEMDSLPNAPAARSDDDPRSNDRYGRRGDDFLSSKPDRGPRMEHQRDDVPLPTNPPYTAFIGNLPFDITEGEMEEFFGPQTKSVKIIKDRDEKPRGFGYVEFVELDGLKGALAKSGSSFSGRTIRVSVAEPPKEHAGAFGREDDGKFDNPWRRDGPLPDAPDRDSSRRRFDGPPGGRDREAPPPSVSDGADQWRSSRSRAPEPEPQAKRSRGPAFTSGAADNEDSWAIGSKFKPSAPSEDGSSSRFGSARGRGDMGPPPAKEIPTDDDWRRPRPAGRNSASPTNSTPATPQMGRRKLELLPRSGGSSVSPTPLASPKGDRDGSTPIPRSNPFGTARPVDVSNREKAVEERLEKDRESTKERLSMSRTSSRQASERPPTTSRTSIPRPASPRSGPNKPPTVAAGVRPTFSFAAIAKRDGSVKADDDNEEEKLDQVQSVQDKLGEVVI
ncbi:hypothetical protein BDN71DRAFT_1450352 [Pleurotus eryngii]|uniref:RRM domain-containing protein n=1 Tax=Pleurotus eryngii TaxID=5323 RepID=A0A9P6D5F3_PLEER|nr:hypothetical protein BDN71DRAFT_1450352 [Pleurotus eryngii]